jgi:hypothetical protein
MTNDPGSEFARREQSVRHQSEQGRAQTSSEPLIGHERKLGRDRRKIEKDEAVSTITEGRTGQTSRTRRTLLLCGLLQTISSCVIVAHATFWKPHECCEMRHIMKTIRKDELYQNLSQFLKGKGIELKEGQYTSGIHAGCSLLADAINLSQTGLERAKTEVGRQFDHIRQVIHEKTAPKGRTATGPTPPPPTPHSQKTATATASRGKRSGRKAKNARNSRRRR